MLTELQYNELEDRYGKLLYKIAHWISGDVATATIEDNVQELWLSLFETINTFTRLNSDAYPDGYEDFKDTSHWNKYVKTALWNNKNSRGKKITQKFNIQRDTVSAWNNEEVMEKEDVSYESTEFNIFLEDMSNFLSPKEENIVRLLVSDPDMINDCGNANKSALASKLNLVWADVSRTLETLGAKLQNEL